MKYSLPWGNIPREARIGNSFDEPIRLFRGDKLALLEEARRIGILSTALANNDLETIYEFGDAVGSPAKWSDAILAMNSHTTMTAQRAGIVTPFISASQIKGFAETFATGIDDAVVEIEVPASRLIAPMMDAGLGHTPMELLIVGGVLPGEVVAVYPVGADKK